MNTEVFLSFVFYVKSGTRQSDLMYISTDFDGDPVEIYAGDIVD